MPVESPTPDVSALVAKAARAVPDGVALVSAGGTRTWAELEDAVARVATGLGRRGVLAGHRVLVLAGNTPEFVVAYLAALRAQSVVVPVNPRSTEDELTRMVADSGSRLLLVEAEHAGVAHRAVARVLAALDGSRSPQDARMDPDVFDELLTRAVRPQVVVLGSEEWQALLATEPVPVPPLQDPEKLAALLYTSGTSGRPRAAMLTHRALLANVEQVAAVEPPMIGADDVVLGALPMFHVYGLNAVLGSVLRQRARLVLVEHFDPDTVLDVVHEHGCTVLPVAPPVFGPWLARPDLRDRLAGVRMVLSGSAPLSAELIDTFAARTGVPVHQGYGLTEAAPVVTSTLCSSALEVGSVGAPLPGVEVDLVDERSGTPEGEDPGEIRIRGANLFSGYWPDGADGPEADGWWRTGDVGFLNGPGNLHLVDRVRDLVIVSGFNVYPVEVEEVLHEVPGVRRAAVVGIPDERTGEAVVAYLLAEADAPDEAAREALAARSREHAGTRLARFKQPSRYEVVETLPETLTGRVQKGRLRGIERRRTLGLLE